MSDDTTGDYDAGHVDGGEQSYDLDHGQSDHGTDASHSLDANQYGAANSYENEQHFEQGHHVEYESPANTHYEEQDFTNLDGHEAASNAAFGDQFSEGTHNEAFGNLEHLQESFQGEHFNATGVDGDGGHEQITAVSK
jgi:hypothetical protein